jgi:hypothetical protein
MLHSLTNLHYAQTQMVKLASWQAYKTITIIIIIPYHPQTFQNIFKLYWNLTVNTVKTIVNNKRDFLCLRPII